MAQQTHPSRFDVNGPYDVGKETVQAADEKEKRNEAKYEPKKQADHNQRCNEEGPKENHGKIEEQKQDSMHKIFRRSPPR